MIEPSLLYLQSLSSFPAALVQGALWLLIPFWILVLCVWGGEWVAGLRVRPLKLKSLATCLIPWLACLSVYLWMRDGGLEPLEWARVNQAFTQSREGMPLVTLSGLKYFGQYWPVTLDLSHGPISEALVIESLRWLWQNPFHATLALECLSLSILVITVAFRLNKDLRLLLPLSIAAGAILSFPLIRLQLLPLAFIVTAIVFRNRPFFWGVAALSRPWLFPILLVPVIFRWKITRVEGASFVLVLILELVRIATPAHVPIVNMRQLNDALKIQNNAHVVFVARDPFTLASQQLSVVSEEYAQENPRRTEGFVSNYLYEEIVRLK